MIVDSAVYRQGVRVPIDADSGDLEAVCRAPRHEGDFVWVGLHDPEQSEMDKVAALFDLHPLAVEDALHAHQRPKLERYGENHFLVLKSLWYVDEHDAVETGEVNLFLGPDYVVSVRHGKGNELGSARQDLEKRSELLSLGTSAVVYAICDRVVDAYEEVAAALETDVDEVESSVFSTRRTESSARIYVLKREIAEMRRAVRPLKEPMSRFVAGTLPGVPAEAAPFFRDVHDHLVRVSDVIDTLDSLLSTAFDAYLARVSVQQNDDMRKISAWVAIAAVSTVIAGVYGMNFTYMPELEWRYGYFTTLGLMALASLVLYRLFKRSGWL